MQLIPFCHPFPGTSACSRTVWCTVPAGRELADDTCSLGLHPGQHRPVGGDHKVSLSLQHPHLLSGADVVPEAQKPSHVCSRTFPPILKALRGLGHCRPWSPSQYHSPDSQEARAAVTCSSPSPTPWCVDMCYASYWS